MVTTGRRRPGRTGVRFLKDTVAALRSFFTIRPHLVRYAVVGLVCTAFQLALFRLLLRYAVPASAANSMAFLLSTQLNFALSHRYTWAHRHTASPLPPRQLLARCVAYNGAAVLGLGINAAAFYGCHSLLAMPPFAAAAAALTVSTVVTYLLSSRVIFVAVRDASPVRPCPHQPDATAVLAQRSSGRFRHQSGSRPDWSG
jgi:putative flippase GtrA